MTNHIDLRPINLRQVRKAKVRDVKEQVAAQNRATFGQSKAKKSLEKAHIALAERRLDGALRDNAGET